MTSPIRFILLFGLSLVDLSSTAPLLSENVYTGAYAIPGLLNARATHGHQDPTKKITLYHGTPVVDKLQDMMKADDGSGIKWSPKGDFSVTAGLYLTDSLRAVAQYGCFGKTTSKRQDAGVIELVWDGTKANVYPYSSWKDRQAYDNFLSANTASTLVHPIGTEEQYKIKQIYQPMKVKEVKRLHALSEHYDMFEGPMAGDKRITKDFWQYAVVNKEAQKNLKIVAGYKVPCSSAPAGKQLNVYDTQGPVDEFPSTVIEGLNLEEVERSKDSEAETSTTSGSGAQDTEVDKSKTPETAGKIES